MNLGKLHGLLLPTSKSQCLSYGLGNRGRHFPANEAMKLATAVSFSCHRLLGLNGLGVSWVLCSHLNPVSCVSRSKD